MPNPLGIPLRKRNKSSPMCDTWGIGCQGFLLWSRPSLPGCKLVQNPQQQLSSQKGLFSVQAIHRESAGQIESFLRENSASVGPLVHAMHGNAGPSIVMVIDPQQRVRATMTRQQRRVDVQRGSPGGLEDVATEEPRERGDTDDVRPKPFELVGEFGIEPGGRLKQGYIVNSCPPGHSRRRPHSGPPYDRASRSTQPGLRP